MKRSALSSLLLVIFGLLVCAPYSSEAQAKLLKNLPVTGVAEEGQPFTGKLTIDALNLANGEMVASGSLLGTVGGRMVVQEFADVPLTLTQTGTSIQQVAPACGILFLDLGPLHLDLLGLTVDLSEVVLEAVRFPDSL